MSEIAKDTKIKLAEVLAEVQGRSGGTIQSLLGDLGYGATFPYWVIDGLARNPDSKVFMSWLTHCASLTPDEIEFFKSQKPSSQVAVWRIVYAIVKTRFGNKKPDAVTVHIKGTGRARGVCVAYKGCVFDSEIRMSVSGLARRALTLGYGKMTESQLMKQIVVLCGDHISPKQFTGDIKYDVFEFNGAVDNRDLSSTQLPEELLERVNEEIASKSVR